MKQLTDTERLEVATSLLGNGVKRDMYHKQCRELELDCKRNGFYNTPAECEDRECAGCQLTDLARHAVDCPYLSEDMK